MRSLPAVCQHLAGDGAFCQPAQRRGLNHACTTFRPIALRQLIAGRHLLRTGLAAVLENFADMSKDDQRNAVIVVDKPVKLPDGREKLSLTPMRAALALDA